MWCKARLRARLQGRFGLPLGVVQLRSDSERPRVQRAIFKFIALADDLTDRIPDWMFNRGLG